MTSKLSSNKRVEIARLSVGPGPLLHSASLAQRWATSVMKQAFSIVLMLPILAIGAESPRHGQIRAAPNLTAWDETAGAWVTPEAFWSSYVSQRGGLTWGEGTEYPPYREVNEHDTFMIRLPTGPCLMEFFHTRWRRANDVRRWDPKFNEYGGCPDVFK